MQQIGPQKYPFKKQDGSNLNPATEETSTSILGFVSDVYNWFVALFPWDLVSARQTARNITDQQIIPAANTIIAGRGLVLPKYDYASLVVSPATTETWTFKTGGSGGTTVATLVIVYTDAGRGTVSSVTKT